MNSISTARQRILDSLTGLGVPVGNEYTALPTPPLVVVRFNGKEPHGISPGAALVEFELSCVTALAAADPAWLDQLVCDVEDALAAAGIRAVSVAPYRSDRDTSTLTAVITAQTTVRPTC